MIYCLTGELLFTDAVAMTAVIDCGGVGYKLSITASTLNKLSIPSRDKSVRLFTHMAVREDAVELYGFYTTEELDAFRLLISISGVGPKAAISILSIMTPDALSSAIAANDAKALSRAPGVGAKIAARIVLELKDKLKLSSPLDDAENLPSAGGGSLADARDALLVLGYSRSEISEALKGCKPGDTESIIRSALAKMIK